jgi:hypothetical protein
MHAGHKADFIVATVPESEGAIFPYYRLLDEVGLSGRGDAVGWRVLELRRATVLTCLMPDWRQERD